MKFACLRISVSDVEKRLLLQAGTCPGNAGERPGATELACSRGFLGRALATPEHKPTLPRVAQFATWRERGGGSRALAGEFFRKALREKLFLTLDGV